MKHGEKLSQPRSRTCAGCRTSFSVSGEDQAFHERMGVTAPTHCPACRQQRRLAVNNEMNLYYRSCDWTGEKIISVYSADKPFVVYKPEVWWSDCWDARSYGRDFEFSRPFFEQFQELMGVVPRVSVQTNYLLDENSDYTNYAGSNKNCYLIFHADFNRDCYYSYGLKKCESCADCFNAFDCELCYECIDCQGCYGCSYTQNSTGCSHSAFLRDCVGCKNCIGCKNMHQKQYCVFNRQLTRAQYEAFCVEHPMSSRMEVESIRQTFAKLCEHLPSRGTRTIQCEGSAGDQLRNCQHVTNSFDVAEMRDGSHCYQVYNGAKDCMDMYQFGLSAELVYEGSIIGYNAQAIRMSHGCAEQVSNLTYCQVCFHGQDLFGCVGVRGKEFCILNKQYSKVEYEALSARIIDHMKQTGEWGEFFPISISPFAYNETSAQLYFPLTQASAQARGYAWKEEETLVRYEGESPTVPDSIAEVDREFARSILTCVKSGKAYRILPQELDLYRQLQVPAPQVAFEQRHRDRIARRNPRHIVDATCAYCEQAMKSTFPKAHRAPLCCDDCYKDRTL